MLMRTWLVSGQTWKGEVTLFRVTPQGRRGLGPPCPTPGPTSRMTMS